MRYDNIFWVLMAPALTSCACFALEMSCNFAESWNTGFEELRHGFQMLGRKAKPENIHVSCEQVPTTKYAEMVVVIVEHKRRR